MAVVKMEKIRMIGHRDRLEELSCEILEDGNIQLKECQKISFNDQFEENIRVIEERNPFNSLINRAEIISENLNVEFKYRNNIDFKDINERNFNKIKVGLEPIYEEVEEWLEYKEELEKREKHLRDIKKQVSLLKNLDIKLEELNHLYYISLIFGRVSRENYERLIKNIVDIPVLILEVLRDEDYVWFFTFTKKENERQALNFLNSIHYDRYQLPADIEGSPEKILQEINFKLENIKLCYEYVKIQFKRLREEYRPRLEKLFSYLKLSDSISKLSHKYYGETEFLFLLEGWIPASGKQKLIGRIENSYRDVIYTVQSVSGDEAPPTLLQNVSWLAPFEKLTLLYDIPEYGELDPSLFLGITYIIMFGLMFGDVGQGLVFLLAGVAIYRRYIDIFSQPVGFFLGCLGISSIFFGFMYGSAFGMENLLPAIWIKPMSNITFLLKITIGLGIFLLLSSMVFNIINSVKRNDLKEALFSKNGFSGIFFYVIALVSAYHIFTEGRFLFKTGVTIFLLVFPLMLILFREPLGNIFSEKNKIWPEEGTQYLVISTFELLETVLGFLSNTISFVRLGAFTLNHIALFMAVFTLAEMLKGIPGGNLWSILLIIIANLIILLLEGLVVGIQVLRLEYYELFSKFYRGGGKSFSPIKIE